jgi:hypothetical protein
MLLLCCLSLLLPVSLVFWFHSFPDLRNDEGDMLRIVDVETREMTSVSGTGRIRFRRVAFGSTAVRSEEDEGVRRSFDVTRCCFPSVRFLRFTVLADFRGSLSDGSFGGETRGMRRLRKGGVGEEREIETLESSSVFGRVVEPRIVIRLVSTRLTIPFTSVADTGGGSRAKRPF